MSHFVRKCECGIVLAQCRCPDPNKRVEVVSPCVHNKPAVADEVPTAVSAKPVLALIAAGAKGDSQEFRVKALEVAKELELIGKQDLALYIYAQFNLGNTFSTND